MWSHPCSILLGGSAARLPCGLSRTWVVSLALSVALALTGCSAQVELMSAMPEAQANEILAALQQGGLEAHKVPGKEGMVGVVLDSAQVGRAVDLLRERGLPRERFSGLGQVFKKEGLISSPLEERARYLYALSQELGETIAQIDGVIVARVHVVLPERTPMGEASNAASAAVFIKHQAGFDLESVQPQIRRLVTNSIPGLVPEKVSIVLVSGQVTRPKVATSLFSGGLVGEGASPWLMWVAALTGVLALAAGGYVLRARWWPRVADRWTLWGPR
jgi:type III secretion protein J